MCNRSTPVPSWYWQKGLHDAIITGIEHVSVPQKVNGRYFSNYLTIELDARYALFDMTIKEIRLYNYGCVQDLRAFKGFWWLEDRLEQKNGKYLLTVQVGNRFGNQTLTIRFTDCEIIR